MDENIKNQIEETRELLEKIKRDRAEIENGKKTEIQKASDALKAAVEEALEEAPTTTSETVSLEARVERLENMMITASREFKNIKEVINLLPEVIKEIREILPKKPKTIGCEACEFKEEAAILVRKEKFGSPSDTKQLENLLKAYSVEIEYLAGLGMWTLRGPQKEIQHIASTKSPLSQTEFLVIEEETFTTTKSEKV